MLINKAKLLELLNRLEPYRKDILAPAIADAIEKYPNYNLNRDEAYLGIFQKVFFELVRDNNWNVAKAREEYMVISNTAIAIFIKNLSHFGSEIMSNLDNLPKVHAGKKSNIGENHKLAKQSEGRERLITIQE